MSKQRLCRICKKRTPWHHKNCPPGVCKRCYHKHIWPDRQSARKPRQDAADEPEERTAGDDIDTDTLLRNRTL